MDFFWNDIEFGPLRNFETLRSQTMPRPRELLSQPRSRRSLTSFPRYGPSFSSSPFGRERRMSFSESRPSGDFSTDMLADFRRSFDDDDIDRRIPVHREISFEDDARSRWPSGFDEMFRDFKPVVTPVSNTAREIPIIHSAPISSRDAPTDGYVINVVRDVSGSGSGGNDVDRAGGRSGIGPRSRGDIGGGDNEIGYRRFLDSETRVPRTRTTGNNVNPSRSSYASEGDVDSDVGRRVSNIAARNRIESPDAGTSLGNGEQSDDERDANLVVKAIDCHVTDNGKSHNTDRFAHIETGLLIVRRGQKFEVTLELNRQFDLRKDQLLVTFKTGKQPQPGKGSSITLRIPDRLFSSVWFAEIVKNTGDQLRLAFRPDAACIVGEWKFAILPVNEDKKSEDDKDKFRMLYGKSAPEIPLVILFNPWCREDRTYFPDTDKLAEYVLNDSGCAFTGTDKQIEAVPWLYGQFEPGVLEAVLYCLQRAFNFRSSHAMGDTVKVARAITRIVNSNDEGGVMTGKWSGNYSDGRSPQLWVGSPAILKKYHQSRRSVKYGQCFVFAGIVTTMCRALGLPCRTVTNFSSGHDSDGSVTVDVHWDIVNNKRLLELDTDSMWNYHVWNDVWMARKDLTFGNDGWQAIDATPQETSEGKFSCGPAPVSAILNGRCDVTYDTPFMFAEVNADRVHWGRQKDGSWNIIGVDKSATGKKVVTKIPDGRPATSSLAHCESYMEDITAQYKHGEESHRERMSVVLANSLSPRARKELYAKEQDIDVEMKYPDHVYVGGDVTISIACRNKSGEQRTLQGKLLVDVTTYTGKLIATCKEEDVVIKMAIYDRHTHVMNIKADEYLRHVSEAAMIRVSFMARAQETEQVLARQDQFRLRTPDLKLKCFNSSCQAGKPLTIQASFKNPLQDKPLSNCYMYFEASGLEEPKLITVRNVSPYREMVCDVDIVLTSRGRRQIFATFFCTELNDVKGVLDVYIQ